MKIGIDGLPLSRKKTGLGHYIFHILEPLIKLRCNDMFFIYAPNSSEDLEQLAQYPNVVIRVCKYFSQSDAIWSQTALPYLCFKDRVDVFWGTTQSVPLWGLHRYKKIMHIYDFVYLYLPKTVSTGRCLYLKWLSYWMLRKADQKITISQATADKLHYLYKITTDMVIHPPIRKEFRPYSEEEICSWIGKKNLHYKQYAISVASFEPRKNLLKTLLIYENILTNNDPQTIIPFLFIGGTGWKNGQLMQLLDRLKTNFPCHIYHIGYCEELELAKYLAGAKFLLFLSQYEGYGMPIAEARKVKTAVICTNSREMRESAENEAVFIAKNCMPDLTQWFRKSSQVNYPFSFECSYQTNEELARCLSTKFDCP